jgi:hypothetical protein
MTEYSAAPATRRTTRTIGTRVQRFAAVIASLALVAGGLLASPAMAATIDADYVAQGPSPITGGQVENVTPNNEVSGAVHTIVAHPADPNIAWIGTVNGGVWRTMNATAASPTWTPLTDQQASLSIGALELDPTVATNTVLLAGIGRVSSFGRISGPQTGLLRQQHERRWRGEGWHLTEYERRHDLRSPVGQWHEWAPERRGVRPRRRSIEQRGPVRGDAAGNLPQHQYGCDLDQRHQPGHRRQ